ncbi:MAG: hypothetical protein ACKVW3_15335 [Phycisphaerales bacterium]
MSESKGNQYVIVCRAPRWLLAALCLVVAAIWFWTYGASRVWCTAGGFGLDSISFFSSVVISLFAPFVIAGALLGAPGIFLMLLWLCVGLVVYWRWKSGSPPDAASAALRCIKCGYSRTGLPADKCPECGGEAFTSARVRRAVAWRPILLALFLGAVVGVVTSESFIEIDEAAFVRKVKAGGGKDCERPRAWPFQNGTLIHESGHFRSRDQDSLR